MNTKINPNNKVKISDRKKLLSVAGIWKGTELDDDMFWKKILTRKSRKKIIKI